MSGITTTYAGRSAIAPGSGDQHAAFAAALASGDPKAAGFTLNEAVIRLTAAGAPLWARRVGKADLSWCVRKPSTSRSKARGTVHTFAHKAEAGATESCMASGDNSHGQCSAVTVSKGDGNQRWRTDSDGNGEADLRIANLTAANLMSAFLVAFQGHIDYLRAKGHKEQDFLDTPGISQRLSSIKAVAGDGPASKVAELLADVKSKPAKAPKAKAKKSKASAK